MKNKVIVVVGPTAVGKTKISIELAKIYNTKIISGDSISIYKRLDIGSAKPTPLELKEVPHYLINIKDPTEAYSAADFQRDARKIINENDLSIICGGTGLYIQAALFNYEFDIRRRDESLDIKYKNTSNEELYEILKAVDPNLDQNRIHPNNRRRVLRALDIYYSTGKNIEAYNKKEEAIYDYYIVYLRLERYILYDRINKRVDKMISDGLVLEAKTLYDEGIYPKGIGYKELIPYFDNDITLETAIDDIKKNSRHLAKRQETWFRNQMKSHFYDVDLDSISNTVSKIKNDIDRWLEK